MKTAILPGHHHTTGSRNWVSHCWECSLQCPCFS